MARFLSLNRSAQLATRLLAALLVTCLLAPSHTWAADDAPKPNIIIIFADDMGYGDVGVYGHPTISTPNIDRIAAEGQKWTQFYTAASVCTPSRAALLTGRLPIRSGMCSEDRGVLFPDSANGLPADEITIAEKLKEQGYATACVGKWHLGHMPQYLPTSQGFDRYFGIPYSNDMDGVPGGVDRKQKFLKPKPEYWNVPLIRDTEVIERPADQTTITKRYTEEAVKFIRESKDGPFFLYLAHSMPHVPLFASKAFQDTSRRGLYGDIIEEIDWSVGQVIQALRDEGLDENTMVVFTSDNGPWRQYREHGGSAGLLYGCKGTTWEGGMRVPGVFWWPGKIKPGVVQGIGSTMDVFTTACLLTGADVPDDRVIDGMDLRPALFEQAPSPRETLFYYRKRTCHAIRQGPYKLHLFTHPVDEIYTKRVPQDPPLLFHLDHDPSERFNIAADHPEIVEALMLKLQQHQDALVPGEDQLIARIEKDDP
jgi:arylsulfatase A